MRAPNGHRLWIATVLLGLVAGGGVPIGCHRNAADKAGQGAPNPDSLKQAFAALKKQADDLQTSFSDLSKEVEAVPADLPDFPQLRARFYAIEEARGITDAKVTMLSGRLEAALRSGKQEELQQVSNDIANASGDVRQIGELYLKLLHQVMAFQRGGDQRKEAAAAATPPPVKTKPSKSKH